MLLKRLSSVLLSRQEREKALPHEGHNSTPAIISKILATFICIETRVLWVLHSAVQCSMLNHLADSWKSTHFLLNQAPRILLFLFWHSDYWKFPFVFQTYGFCQQFHSGPHSGNFAPVQTNGWKLWRGGWFPSGLNSATLSNSMARRQHRKRRWKITSN